MMAARPSLSAPETQETVVHQACNRIVTTAIPVVLVPPVGYDRVTRLGIFAPGTWAGITFDPSRTNQHDALPCHRS